MAFYYFKNGGTATGDAGRYATEQTGSFAGLGIGGYYNNADAAFAATTSPVAGDAIRGSRLHTFNNTSASSWSITAAIGAELTIISVSDTAIDSALAGAEETWNDGLDLTLTGNVTIYGMDLSIGDDLISSTGSRTKIIDSNITLTGAGDSISLNAVGSCLTMINTDIITVATNGNTGINLNNGKIEMIGGRLIDGGAALINFIRGGGNGDLDVNLVGVDMTSVTGTIFADFGASTADDFLRFRAQGCAINAAAAWTNEDFGFICQTLLATNSSDTSAAGLYQFYYKEHGGTVQQQDDTGIYRDETTAFADGTKVSFKVDTLAVPSITRPLVFDLPARFAQLSSASTDTVRIYFASTSTLTDNDIWAELYYPDGASNHIYNRLSNQNTDILAVGTTHTDDSASSDWRDGASPLAGYNEYRMDLDTSSDVGADSVPVIRIHCAIPSATIYIDVKVDTVA